MSWISWSLLASVLLAILGTYIWLDQLGRFPFNYFLTNASEHTWQLIVIALVVTSYMILLVDNILTLREKRALERLKSTSPIVNAWLEIADGEFFMVVIECKILYQLILDGIFGL
jgi:divalent metal cation (Fe/Co/Zn/Cd) transporter